MGTKVGLLTKITVRSDISVQYENFQWTFMAVLFWGEDPNGDWKLELLDSGTDVGKYSLSASLRSGYCPGGRANKTYLLRCYSEPSLMLKSLFYFLVWRL